MKYSIMQAKVVMMMIMIDQVDFFLVVSKMVLTSLQMRDTFVERLFFRYTGYTVR